MFPSSSSFNKANSGGPNSKAFCNFLGRSLVLFYQGYLFFGQLRMIMIRTIGMILSFRCGNSNMFPQIPAFYPLNHGVTDVEGFCDFFIATRVLFYLYCILVCQLISTEILFSVSMAVFFYAILFIVFCCSKENMIRVHAGGIVAFMKTPKSLWNWAIIDFPCHTRSYLISAIDFHFPISTFAFAFYPFPAPIRHFYNACLKTFLYRLPNFSAWPWKLQYVFHPVFYGNVSSPWQKFCNNFSRAVGMSKENGKLFLCPWLPRHFIFSFLVYSKKLICTLGRFGHLPVSVSSCVHSGGILGEAV